MIRKAEISDVDAILDCRRRAILAISPAFYDGAQISAWVSDSLPGKYTDSINLGEIFVSVEASVVEAFGWIKFNPAEIRAVYVSPSHQGRGAGSEMLLFLEEKLRALGAKEIMLGASLNAQSFYAKHRYIPGAPGVLEIGGVSSPYIMMTKQLR